MEKTRVAWILHLGFVLVSLRCVDAIDSQHRALRDYLLKDYGATIRPVKTPKTQTNVTFRPLFRSLIDMDIKNQNFKITAAVKMTWKDEFLTWNTTDFDGIDFMHLSASHIWLPDITLDNSSEPEQILSDSRVRIHSDGMVHWYYSAEYTSGCGIYVKWFPFDTQVCIMSFVSWAHTGQELDLLPDLSKDGTQDSFFYNGVWDLVDMTIKKKTNYFLCCDYPFYDVHYCLVFKREPSFYVNYLILPFIVLSCLSVTVFFLPPEMPSKLQFSITNLLALAVFQKLVAEIIPPVAVNAPVIDVYFQLMIIVVGLSVLSTVTVVNISNRYREPIPSWLEMLVFNILSHVVGLHTITKQELYNKTASSSVDKTQEESDTSLDNYAVNRLNSEGTHKAILVALANTRKQGATGDEDDEGTNVQGYRNTLLAEKWKVIGLIVSRCFALLFAVIVFTCTTTILIYIKIMSGIAFDNALGEDRIKWLNETVTVFNE